ncbi:hypothetical protein DN439_05540 [Lactobacillus reuteri]|uniref:hypothetical protein n=1 Tax=Limosilactobacillus reuteri TaxID=1598 RepID=UPI00128BF602|nr:hypothetical protein [Limosilactobacillus reuteri]MQB73086.1 hypothetical protein [Limosilactobacillus reuteri]
MLTQSKETRDAWRASQRTLDIKVTIDGKTYGATDINSLKYDSGAYNGDTFAIGSTYSNTVQIEFSHLIEGLKLGMEVRPSIGIKTSSGYVYEPLGVFIISSEIKMDRNNNLTTVSASDRFCGLEGTYVSKLTYPAKVLDVIAEICAQSGVKANTDDLARLPHQADLPAPITGQSYRKALGWIAQLYVGYALFDRQGLFTIRTISEPNYELDPSQYEQAGLTKNEAAYKINGIQCQVTLTTKTRDGESTEETKNYQAGDATGSQIKLENNIMTPQRLNDIWEQLKDITFYPFSLNWFGNPAVEAGDWLRLEDKQGNSFVVPNSSYTLDFNGGLSATSKADQTTSSDQMVPWQGSVAQTIKELQLRRLPDGTVVFPPSVTAPPTNAKFNDVWFRKNGNATELWVFEKQDDGSGKWVRKDLTEDEIKHQIEQAQAGLNQAKADIINNKQKADQDIENLNKSIEANKKVADQDIQNLNKSIEDNKKVADESLKKLNDSVTNLQGQYDNNIVPDLTKVTNDVADALQKYISAQNNIADLTKQAQAQGKNIADVTNTVKGLNINYANLLGDVNSTKVDVKGMQTTVGTANGDIVQLKLDAQNLQTMLAGKVDNTTYTNFVNLTNQALNARLTASDLNGYAKTADMQATANGLKINIDSVSGKLDNLMIGGKNLLYNSAGPFQPVFDGRIDNNQRYNNSTVNLVNGRQYTISGETNGVFSGDHQPEVESDKCILWLVNTSQNINRIVSDNNTANGTTFIWNRPTGTYILRVNTYHPASTNKIKAWNIKIESGNKKTDWSPAPEDVEQAFAEVNATINGLKSTVSGNYGQLQNTISQTNQATRNELINKITGVENTTTSTANSLNSVIGRIGSLEHLTSVQVVNNAINANDYTTTGTYFVQSTSSSNVPATNWCYLEVKKVDNGRIVQTWQADSDPTLRYVRTKIGDSWTQWQRSASYSEYSELNRTVQGLQSTVSNNHGELQSQISQTAKTIRQEVSDKTNGLQTQINQQGNNFNVSLNSLRKETAWQKVTSAIDANNYKTTGNYWIQAAPNSNTPDSSAWAYFQVVAYSDAKRIKQTWQRDNNENDIYTRLLIGDNWTSWQRTVTGGNIMAQINMSAGTTLIQNDKIYMDSSSTIFSGKAFIPDAAITNISADKITAGTLDAGRINVINLNANNITAGTLRGSNGEFYLDSGSLHVWQGDHNAWIDKNGIHDSDNSGNNVWISNGSISAYGNSSGAYLFDGGLYLHKSQSLSDAVLNPNYGSITKSDNIVSFGTSGLDIDGKDGFLLKTHGWNDQTLAYLNGNEIIGAGIAGKSDGFMNIAAKKQLFLYAGEPVQNDKLKTIPKLVLDGTYQNGQTALKGTFSQYFFQGPSSGFSGGITLQDEFVNVGSLNGKNYFSINSDGAITITANGKSILSLNGLFPGVNSDFNVRGNFAVTGSKNAIVPTSRGMAAINAYETAEYYFGDIGETQTNSNGVVTVMIDPYFLETVNTLVPYQVFLTSYGDGNVWVSSRSANNFTVKSSNPNIHFAWEIKAKRKGYENDRMKIVKGVFNNEQY